ncbi:hypothetical protein CDAR_398551 [Caerostris darwini]|uniref:Uncharacterized protein n=1 Tax=Caerostris darwini TaxID=1538125 RepID=A0AAV4VEI0_9ARAC|nr:hypothetical protein CDAR_398551 [Caerostris darwini]
MHQLKKERLYQYIKLKNFLKSIFRSLLLKKWAHSCPGESFFSRPEASGSNPIPFFPFPSISIPFLCIFINSESKSPVISTGKGGSSAKETGFMNKGWCEEKRAPLGNGTYVAPLMNSKSVGGVWYPVLYTSLLFK